MRKAKARGDQPSPKRSGASGGDDDLGNDDDDDGNDDDDDGDDDDDDDEDHDM